MRVEEERKVASSARVVVSASSAIFNPTINYSENRVRRCDASDGGENERFLYRYFQSFSPDGSCRMTNVVSGVCAGRSFPSANYRELGAVESNFLNVIERLMRNMTI